MTGTAQVEDFRQVTPRTSDMDDGASASTANTGARSIEAAAGAGVGGKKGADKDNSSSPSTIKGTYSAGEASNSIDGTAKTPAASTAGTARGSKKDKSPEELTAAEALITTAKQRYVYPPAGHPGPFYTQYYAHGGVPLPPPHGPYNSALPPPPPPPPPPQTPGANTVSDGVPQPIPTDQSYRDLPSPSAVAAAVVAASKEIAAGGRSTATASPDKASRPDSSAANGAMTTPARKKATEGEDDVVDALLEMKTSSAEKKKGQQQTQISPSSPNGAGGGTIEGAAASVPTINPAEWARQLPLRLSTPKDEIHLNRLHCFIRSTLLELFVMPVGKSTDSNLQGLQYQAGEIRYHSVALAHRRPQPPHPPPPNWHRRFPVPPGPPPRGLPLPLPLPPPPAHIMAPQAPLTQGQQKTAGTASGSAPPTAPTPVPPGPQGGNTSAAKKMPPPSSSLRVGIRCVFCARAQREQAKRVAQRGGKAPPLRAAPMGSFYPKNLAEIYNLVSRFQRIHFKECRFVPPTIRKQFTDHKENDKSRGRREYWIKSAKAIGLVDDKNGRGIRFVPPNAFGRSEATSNEKTPSNTVHVDGGGVGGSGGGRAEPSCPPTAGCDVARTVANSILEAMPVADGSKAKAAGESEDEVPDDTEAKTAPSKVEEENVS